MKRILSSIVLCIVAIASYAQTAIGKETLSTNRDIVEVVLDGKKM